MQIEFTGRHFTIYPKLHAQAQTALDRIEIIVGSICTAHVILTEDSFRKTAEVNLQCPLHPDLTASCEAKEMEQALHDALDKVEKQAVKISKKANTLKRHPEQSAEGSVRLQTEETA